MILVSRIRNFMIRNNKYTYIFFIFKFLHKTFTKIFSINVFEKEILQKIMQNK